MIIRLFEPTGRKRTTVLKMPVLDAQKKLTMDPFEIKTLRLNPRNGEFAETNLLEE